MPCGAAPAAAPFFPRSTREHAVIRRRGGGAGAPVARRAEPRAGGQWLLDNASLIDEQVNEVLAAAGGATARLPVLCGELLDGLPRIYGIAWAWSQHSDSGLDAELSCAPACRPMTASASCRWRSRGRCPTTLRLVLIENLRRWPSAPRRCSTHASAPTVAREAYAPALAELEHLGQGAVAPRRAAGLRVAACCERLTCRMRCMPGWGLA